MLTDFNPRARKERDHNISFSLSDNDHFNPRARKERDIKVL